MSIAERGGNEPLCRRWTTLADGPLIEVVESVRAGRFHVWSARTVEEGIELLTGIPAGERGPDGQFADGTLHARVEERLERWAGLAEEIVAAS